MQFIWYGELCFSRNTGVLPFRFSARDPRAHFAFVATKNRLAKMWVCFQVVEYSQYVWGFSLALCMKLE